LWRWKDPVQLGQGRNYGPGRVRENTRCGERSKKTGTPFRLPRLNDEPEARLQRLTVYWRRLFLAVDGVAAPISHFISFEAGDFIDMF